MNLYFDTEFTGLHKNTTLISLGVVSDNDKTFYAEFLDYDKSQVDRWLEQNVISYLNGLSDKNKTVTVGSHTEVYGDKAYVRKELTKWISQFHKVHLWSDTHHYDVVLFQDIFGGAFSIPENIYYIPFDIATYMKVLGVDPDVTREDFIDRPIDGVKHHALYDAKVIRACYEKLERLNKNL